MGSGGFGFRIQVRRIRRRDRRRHRGTVEGFTRNVPSGEGNAQRNLESGEKGEGQTQKGQGRVRPGHDGQRRKTGGKKLAQIVADSLTRAGGGGIAYIPQVEAAKQSVAELKSMRQEMKEQSKTLKNIEAKTGWQ